MKCRVRTYSKVTQAAAQLLGQRIRIARKQKRWSEQSLADRAGVARATVQKIERGDLGCSVGLVFELATLVGVPLFEPEAGRLKAHIAQGDKILALLPKHTHMSRRNLDDDF